MRRFFWIVGIAMLISCVGLVIYSNQTHLVQTHHQTAVVKSSDSSPKQSTMTTPRRFIVPSLGIEKPIIGVGLTPTGDMDTPPNNDSLGWYINNPEPGDVGAAVLAAHAGPPDNPSVFQKLQLLKKGAIIKIEDRLLNIASFEVTETAIYQPDTAPRERIFSAAKESRLAVITCTGEWSASTQTYSHRFVVFATRKS